MSMPPPPPPPPPGSVPPPPPAYQMPPGYQAHAQQAAPQYASWGARVGGHLLNLLVYVLFFVPAVVAFFVVPTKIERCTVNGEVGLCELPTGPGWAIIAGLAILGAVAYFVLYGRMIARSGQAWGHKVVGVRIVDARTGGNIGAGKAVGRFLFGHWIDGLPCSLGYLWPLWDSQKQTFADKIFSTFSVRA